MFRIVFWDVLMMEAVRTSETSVDNYFTRQYKTRLLLSMPVTLSEGGA
jgi:hypothetical protein